jgi:hypothetical protein
MCAPRLIQIWSVSLQAEGNHEQALKAFQAAAAFLGDVRAGDRRRAVAGIRILCGLGTAELAAGHHAMAASVLERCLQVHACLHSDWRKLGAHHES